LPPYRNLGSDALFSCDICLYIPVDSTLLHSSVAIKRKLSSSSTLQIPTRVVSYKATSIRLHISDKYSFSLQANSSNSEVAGIILLTNNTES
jgi:hypothetical protein